MTTKYSMRMVLDTRLLRDSEGVMSPVQVTASLHIAIARKIQFKLSYDEHDTLFSGRPIYVDVSEYVNPSAPVMDNSDTA